ncbi:myosin heavy chain, clone 203 [Ananas comosus]|uniref:Myosin heavy chain, clone 203 n=1 Tax=Ananas comosus TaxID=4615 RepID=A0A6P5GQD8_ANACO|nr:myosin heavy chain, clone 203 [Ananas comosus]XP_020108193.1 myosin heavy chain, clone 203 [Ananas comosus]
MDSKKKRNRKKKGNQGKNNEETASNAEDVVVQEHNHDLTTEQNHDSLSQQNHHGQNSSNVDVQNAVVSESEMELEKHKYYEAEFVKLNEAIRKFEDEKDLWLRKEINFEDKLGRLENKVDSLAQDRSILEEKLNYLQNGNDSSVQKEVTLEDKVKSIEGIKDSLILKETSIKEAIAGLEEVNRALQTQVKELEQSRDNVIQENQRLVENLSMLQSRIEILETKVVSKENPSVNVAQSPEGKVYVPSQGQNTEISQVHGKMIETDLHRDHSTDYLETFPNNDLNQVIALSRTSTPVDHAQEYGAKLSQNGEIANQLSIQIQGNLGTNHINGGFADSSSLPGQKTGLDEPRMSEEIVTVPLDEIEIHEEESQGVMNNLKEEEVPLTDAPLIGAPFRLISFVAKYVSGSDLVNQNTSRSGH